MSIRLLWPFARLLGPSSEAIERLLQAGLSPGAIGDPDTRIPHRLAMQLLELAVERTHDPTLGLRAGSGVDALDFDVLERVARTAPTLREAIRCMARYFRLLHGAAEIGLEEEGDRAVWSHRVTDGVPQPPAANDFVIASALAFGRRNTGVEAPVLEVHFVHPEPAYSAEYRRVTQAPLVFGAPCNALVLVRSRLDAPILGASRAFSAAAESHARKLLERLQQSTGVAGRVREIVAADLAVGKGSMHDVARRLAMSIATLRRRLEEEGTTYSDVLDGLRQELAERYLGDPNHAVTEVAFLLGFANVGAFHRAFRRWQGMAPSEYRARARAR